MNIFEKISLRKDIHSPLRFKVTLFGPSTMTENEPVSFGERVVTTNIYVMCFCR